MIPEEHRLICEGCGKKLDMRDINVLGHGWIENGEIVCYDTDFEYSGSQKIGSSEFYTKNKQLINLN